MKLNLEGQTAAVFGAANGIGRAIAEGFVAEQSRVWTLDRDPDAAPCGEASSTGDVTRYAFDACVRFDGPLFTAEVVVHG